MCEQNTPSQESAEIGSPFTISPIRTLFGNIQFNLFLSMIHIGHKFYLTLFFILIID